LGFGGKMTFPSLLLILLMLAGPLYAEDTTPRSDKLTFVCGQYLDNEKNLTYTISLEQIKKADPRDLARIALYGGIVGADRFSSPGMHVDDCRELLPEKYLVKK
jgi:hypothetical protein